MTSSQPEPIPTDIPVNNYGNAITRFLRLIRFSHTIFALPFALASLIVAANGHPSLRIFVLVILCMILARTAAMLFNRVVDWGIDQRNPRTRSRHLLASKPIAILSIIVSSALFIFCAAKINSLTFALSPVALALIFFYSLTKRFTDTTHFFLGLALGIAPIAAWIAQTGRVGLPPVILAFGVICWVAGFDLIYSIQDYDFGDSPDVPSAFEVGRQPHPHDRERCVFGNYALAERKDIGVIVLSRKPGDFFIPAKRTSDAAHLVRRHRLAIS